ncbi:MAG TPA: J domain-containing protein [Rhodopila sp.]|nr:J domain-containing protein [Rhodopila sp.]
MMRRPPHAPGRPRAYAPDPAAPPGRACDMPGCPEAGEYRAPKSRTSLNDYYWFCLEHVRAYNAGWDFYKGMSPAEVEAQLRADTSWQRPTWPIGSLGHAAWEEDVLKDPLHILAAARMKTSQRPDPQKPPTELREPLATLGLSWPTTLDAVKTRYKELAKRHHPDANGGSRDAEERLKTINLAYAAVRSRLGSEARVAAAE